MPDVKIYVRAGDYEKWLAIESKAEFIHKALNACDVIFRENKSQRPIKLEKGIEPHKALSNVIEKMLCEHGCGFKLCLDKKCKNYQFRRV